MNCNFDIPFTNYNFIQKSIFISNARDAQGNVMATYPCISENIFYSKNYNYVVSKGSEKVNYYSADVISYSDYYPFGMLMPNRYGQSDDYRYGYQGSEKDNEVHGQNGTSYTTHFRQLDTRIGRWLSRDPLANKFPWQSPYVSMDNNPIKNNDKNGDKVPVTGKKEAQNKLLKQVNETTGGCYKIDKNGELKAKWSLFGRKYGKGTTADLFKAAIKSNNTIPIEAVENSEEVFFDSYVGTQIDVSDISKGDKHFKKGVYSHIMSERLKAGKEYENKADRKKAMKSTKQFGVTLGPMFSIYHGVGKNNEAKAVGESLGMKAGSLTRSDELIIRNTKLRNTIILREVTGHKINYGNGVIYTIEIEPYFINKGILQSTKTGIVKNIIKK